MSGDSDHSYLAPRCLSVPMVFPAKVGAKSRIYIPREVVAVLKVKKGEHVIFRITDGKISIEKLK